MPHLYFQKVINTISLTNVIESKYAQDMKFQHIWISIISSKPRIKLWLDGTSVNIALDCLVCIWYAYDKHSKSNTYLYAYFFYYKRASMAGAELNVHRSTDGDLEATTVCVLACRASQPAKNRLKLSEPRRRSPRTTCRSIIEWKLLIFQHYLLNRSHAHNITSAISPNTITASTEHSPCRVGSAHVSNASAPAPQERCAHGSPPDRERVICIIRVRAECARCVWETVRLRRLWPGLLALTHDMSYTNHVHAHHANTAMYAFYDYDYDYYTVQCCGLVALCVHRLEIQFYLIFALQVCSIVWYVKQAQIFEKPTTNEGHHLIRQYGNMERTKISSRSALSSAQIRAFCYITLFVSRNAGKRSSRMHFAVHLGTFGVHKPMFTLALI